MQLPRYTWKSALWYLIGVAALLVVVYFIAIMLFNSTSRQRAVPETPVPVQGESVLRMPEADQARFSAGPEIEGSAVMVSHPRCARMGHPRVVTETERKPQIPRLRSG